MDFGFYDIRTNSQDGRARCSRGRNGSKVGWEYYSSQCGDGHDSRRLFCGLGYSGKRAKKRHSKRYSCFRNRYGSGKRNSALVIRKGNLSISASGRGYDVLVSTLVCYNIGRSYAKWTEKNREENPDRRR